MSRQYLPNRVYLEDLREVKTGRVKPGFCLTGSREWFKRYGFDFKVFVREGIEAEKIEATGDALGQMALEQMRKRENNGRRKE